MTRFGPRSRPATQVASWLPPAGFSPTQLSPLVWLDAADTSTVAATSGAVHQWSDKSGNGRNVSQSIATNQPTTGTVTQNGLNCIDFDGTNDVMSWSQTLTATVGFWVFAIARPDVITGGNANYQQRPIVEAYTGGSVQDFAVGVRDSKVSVYGEVNSVLSREAVTTTITAGTWYLIGGKGTATELIARVNGVSGSSPGGTRNDLILRGIGRNSAGAGELFFDGPIGEILIFNGDISADTISIIETYLNTKWAVY